MLVLEMGINTEHYRYINPTFDSVYPAYAQKTGFVPEIVTMKDGTKAYWVGNSKSEDVVIWYHGSQPSCQRPKLSHANTDSVEGGGYTLPADPAHMILGSVLVENAKAAGKELGVLFLAYSLAPQAQYPRQLQQGVEMLRYALDELGRRPGNIIIGGDSAGQPRKPRACRLLYY